MRPIIGVNGDCLWLCGDVFHSPPSLSAPRSHGKLRRRLTGTGVGSNFRFVSDLELKPASDITDSLDSHVPGRALTGVAVGTRGRRRDKFY